MMHFFFVPVPYLVIITTYGGGGFGGIIRVCNRQRVVMAKADFPSLPGSSSYS